MKRRTPKPTKKWKTKKKLKKSFAAKVLGDSFFQIVFPPSGITKGMPQDAIPFIMINGGARLLDQMIRSIPRHPLVPTRPAVPTGAGLADGVPSLPRPSLAIELHKRKVGKGSKECEIVEVSRLRVSGNGSVRRSKQLDGAETVIWFDSESPISPKAPAAVPSAVAKRTRLIVSHAPSKLATQFAGTTPKETVVLVSANALREVQSKCKLGSLSCEQAVEDLWRELKPIQEKEESTPPTPAAPHLLAKVARHLVIALSPGSAIYCEFQEKGELEVTLVYQPQDGYHAVSQLGTDAGFPLFLAAGLGAHLVRYGVTPEQIIEGVKHGIGYCLKHRQQGFAAEHFKVDDPCGAWCRAIFGEPPDLKLLTHKKILQPPFERAEDWSLLGEACPKPTKPKEKDVAMDVALEIIRKDVEEASASSGFPYARVGVFKYVDRQEIEGYQSLRSLMRSYLEEADRNKPLCLSAFGPPGSGKSAGIKETAKDLAEELPAMHQEALEFNLSELSSVSGLAPALHRARDVALQGKVPLVLIDEFDSTFDGRPLGWLKYLLAPMQDGRFREGDSVYSLGRCILMFVGGTRRTFEEFAAQMRNRDFIESKGPDFVSRLRGHVNIRGINCINEEDYLYVVRRAVVLRYHLELKLGKQFDANQWDEAVVKTFLSIPQYRHGVRSMEAIIQMCDAGSPRRQLTRTSIPPRDQLDMHVDAAQFWELMSRH